MFYPKEVVRTVDGQSRVRPFIPHVIFVKTTPEEALDFEARGRMIDDMMPPLWVYRNHPGGEIQAIPNTQIALLRLLTASDSTRCEIFRKENYRPGQKVRVTSGPFEGYTGTIQRVRKNRHVAVRIEGICTVLLPFIHPDLLTPID